MRLILLEYLHMLRESGEFDALLPDLLLAMGIVSISKAQIGVRQAGVDLSAVGDDEDGVSTLWLFVLKRGDLGRRDWDTTPQSVRQSLDEIKDVYLRSNIAPEHAGLPVKIIIATTGDFKQDFEQQRAGYAEDNTKPERNYEFWNGDRVAMLIEKYLLDEYALPITARSDLRRALALVGEPDYELDHFYALLRTLLKPNDKEEESSGKTEREHLRDLRTVSLALGILCRWAAQENNLRSPVIACERSLLWAWDTIRLNGLVDNRKIIKAYARIVEIYLNTTVEYFNKIQGHLHTQDAISRYYQESSLFTEKVFEEIGLIASIGLSHLLWGEMTNDNERIDGANLIADSLSTFLITHPVSGSPCYDGQSIDISLALLFLFLTKQVDSVKGWLQELSGRLALGFRSQHWFPISTDSFDDLVDLEVNRNDIDMKKLMDSSWLVPLLAQWMAILEIEEAYTTLVGLQNDVLKDTNFQLWYPDNKTDDYLYSGPAHIESGITEAPIDLPDTVEEMRAMMRRIRTESPVKGKIVSTANKAGINLIDFIAYRHFRTPMDPVIWQDIADDSVMNPLSEETDSD